MNELSLNRVTVDNEVDWIRVKENITSGITRSMEARLASLPGGKDGSAAKAVRKEVEARIAKIQEEMFAMAVPNLRVNGHNYEDFVDATEPWDEALDHHVSGLFRGRVAEQIAISEYRRNRPSQIHRVEEDLQKRLVAAEWLPPDEDDSVTKPTKKAAEIPAPPRHQEVVETFEAVVANISELSTNIPKQLSRAQRAKTVKQEVENMSK